MPKNPKLDSGFEEVPLDEGFEETAPAKQAKGLDEGFDEVPHTEAKSGDVSKTESALRGAGKGVTFGAQPVLAGAGAFGMQAITGNQGPKEGRDLEALMASYKEMRDSEINKNEAAKKAHPLIYGASELAGTIPTTVATGALGKVAGATGLETAAAQGGA